MGTCFTEAREQNYRARDQELEVNNQASEVVSQRVQHDEKQRIALKIECANSIYSIMFSCLGFFCDHVDYSPWGSPVYGISWASILEWVAISSTRGSSWPRGRTHISCIGRQIIFYQAIWEQKIEHREENAIVFKDMVPDAFYYWVLLRYATNFFSPLCHFHLLTVML